MADEIAPNSISQIAAPRGLSSRLSSQGPAGSKIGSKIVGKITWQKAGRVAEPGRYMHRFGWLTVTAEDLAIWRQYPQAEFTMLQLPKPYRETPAEDALSDLDEYHLGTFELPRA